MRVAIAALAIAGGISSSGFAQTSAPIIAAAPVTGSVLRTGTTVPLRMLEGLTTQGKLLKVGYRFRMEVAEAVTLDGQTVIPAGSPAVGEVIDVRNKGMWGRSGRIGVRVLYADVNGRRIRLTGATDDKGITGTAGVVGAIVLVPVAGFFMTGTSARIPAGTPVNAFLDEDVTVQMAGGTQSAPIVVAPAVTASVAQPIPAPK